MTSPKYLYKFLFIAVFFLSSYTAQAQAPANTYLTAVNEPRAHLHTGSSLKTEADALPENLDLGMTKAQQRRQLLGYLKQITANDDVSYNQPRVKHLYRMANLFTRLRLYPLAMKCFFKAIKIKNDKNADIDSALSDSTSAGYLAVNSKDDSVVEKQMLVLKNIGAKDVKSKNISCKKIIETFNDGKKAVAYALVFHVKQPVRGKRKIFVLANTGHTFITLIKYNSDSTYASVSFGFYPKKDNPLSATPIEPSTSSTFKDDTEHQWDEVLGKFISKRRFNKILALTQQYNNISYHLSKNNCTDFGLKAATLAGLSVWDTTGSWPLGHGNNPAVTGQSILDGKYENTDTKTADDILVDSNPDSE